MENRPPEIQVTGLGEAIRGPVSFSVFTSDADSGLRAVHITLSGAGRDAELLNREFAADIFRAGEVREERFHLKTDPKTLGIPEGEASFLVRVRDHSWRRWFNGNAAEFKKRVLVDMTPPVITVLSNQHNIAVGGSGLIVYTLSEPCAHHGVKAGETFYPGYPADTALGDSGAAGVYLCFFAVSDLQTPDTALSVVAEDRAGNPSAAGFYHHIRMPGFAKDKIPVSNNFLNRKMPEFTVPPGVKADTLVDKFLYVNRTIRKKNIAGLRKACTRSDGRIHWEGTFRRLPGSVRKASYADRREYIYNNHIIDRQRHMGIDLASTARAEAPAANHGRVAFTGNIGIFGLTVVVDHGLNLFSTYSHLSEIRVKPDQMIRKGDIIGRTGATGLAGGDHLHLGMMVGETFVEPVEWWDASWLRNNITKKLQAAAGKTADTKTGNGTP